MRKAEVARQTERPSRTPSKSTEFRAAPPLPERMALVAERETAGIQRTFSIPRAPALIQFPDGEFIAVEFRRVPPPPPVDLTLDAGDLPSAANPSAAGDLAFARYQAAAACLAALGDEQAAAATAAYCTKDRAYYAASRNNWLTKAADDGNVHAVRVYAHENAQSDRALELNERMWHAGYISALGSIADAYFSEPGLGGVLQDRRKGFAYLWLQAHLQDAAAGGGRRLYVEELFKRVRTKEEQMEPADIEAAMELAKGLLRENVRCCFGP
jgi:hypothetical protein